MSMTHSLVLAAASVKDNTVVQDAAASVAQNAATAVAEVAGKGGFTATATLAQLIEFQLTGLLVVFVVLGGLTAMCSLMAWILKVVAPDQYYCRKSASGVSASSPGKPASTSPPAAIPSSIHPGLANDELLAILAIAATEVLGQKASVVRFRTMDSMDWTWSVQGRVGLHSAHKF